jgi:hypothetical protein
MGKVQVGIATEVQTTTRVHRPFLLAWPTTSLHPSDTFQLAVESKREATRTMMNIL